MGAQPYSNGLRIIGKGPEDPRVTAKFGKIGDIYSKTTSPVGVFVKLDNGTSTNWLPVTAGAGITSHNQRMYVDPVDGDDATGDGSLSNPFLTITAALADISDNTALKPYDIFLFEGVTVEPAPVAWKPHVSLITANAYTSELNEDILLVAAAAETSSQLFQRLRFAAGKKLDIDLTAGTAVIVVVESLIGDIDYDGGTPPNQLIISESNLGTLNHISGLMLMGNSTIITTALAIGDSAFTNLFCQGAIISSPIAIAGRASLQLRDSVASGTITGTIATATTPSLYTDRVSINRLTLAGDLVVTSNENNTVPVNANHAVTATDTYILVDATGGDVDIDLPLAAACQGMELVVKKIDASANLANVNAVGGEFIDGLASQVLAVQNAKIRISSDGTTWNVIG